MTIEENVNQILLHLEALEGAQVTLIFHKLTPAQRATILGDTVYPTLVEINHIIADVLVDHLHDLQTVVRREE